ncbi:MAG: glycosyltransferase family 4 protein [Actinomycetota bacterium]|nr:glycosyltransferase family 4 protein [Actinomycetota bacterium]
MTYPYSLSSPGGGTLGCIEIARRLEEKGVDLVLVPVERDGSREQVTGLSDVRPVRPSKVHSLLDAAPVFRRVFHAVRETPTDLIIGWLHEAALIPFLAREGGPSFAMIAAMPSYKRWFGRTTGLRGLKRIPDTFWRMRPLRRAKLVFALSQFTKDELMSTVGVDPARVIVAYWGVDSSFGQIQRQHSTTVRRFIFYGSLDPVKGVYDALEVMRRLGARGVSNFTLRIAGWGDEAAVRDRIKAHALENVVTFLGRLDHSDLRDELKRADLAILPSRSESFGLSIAEAQASGLPVVSYETGAVPEVVENGKTGWLVPANDIELLTEAVIQAMDHPHRALQMGLRARERIYTRFSWDRTASVILEALQRVQSR